MERFVTTSTYVDFYGGRISGEPVEKRFIARERTTHQINYLHVASARIEPGTQPDDSLWWWKSSTFTVMQPYCHVITLKKTYQQELCLDPTNLWLPFLQQGIQGLTRPRKKTFKYQIIVESWNINLWADQKQDMANSQIELEFIVLRKG